MISQLQVLRKSFERMTTHATPSPHREPKPKKVTERPTASMRMNLISRAPEFEQIQEDDTEYEESKRPDPQFIPLPEDEESPKSVTDTITTRRKPLRRQSGLLGPSKARVSLSPDEVAPSVADEEEVAELLSGNGEAGDAPVASGSGVAKSRRKPKPTDGNTKGLKDVTNSPPRRGHTNAPPPQAIMTVLAEAAEEGTSGSRTENLRLTQFPKDTVKAAKRAMEQTQPPPKRKPAPVSSASDTEVPVATTSRKSVSGSRAIPVPAAALAPPPSDATDSDGPARPTRARKSVNYAEPKLNT